MPQQNPLRKTMLNAAPVVLLASAIIALFSAGCKKQEAKVAEPAPAPAAQDAAPAPEIAANVPDPAAAQKSLELFTSHPNAYIKNNAAEAIKQWKAHDYVKAAAAFQTVISLVKTEADRSQLLPVVGSFMKELRAAAKTNPQAQKALQSMNQTLGSP